ncbi:hypothetical protein RhiirA5_351304 [Rhizophagus irregularis]|uniref:Methyltransferase-domain-containing protein n=3 Tax=Rhizophagus irregularis TaxID=588596 RepID=U9UMG3_RHIID|nr:hypothetical protein GLOIN_2v1611019 [Rhizophagus irregularis DAOM 181602=DAOM 197198]EXX52430.1 hypothetical protein RirG_253160 [Rhizophagus irregularis DAOM 197198w]PKC13695.1 hypothetical protein RhiirA5_351304 [Rhizophagus irregularis]POG71027.1 hypothetical protein GLOIN_2v1611019 [Rhizophagus irregularis DAOM 181602=DAOM 197198]UZO02140.1 hypothetical protein OCT59_020634 [Rhizophagus irregularis]CAB4469764.1 unnamed protein product [Rhizophagus irregularis]|eukprot:XP_025177893.1 hypothetical protein GLOIN_2v1611019 [Rhizophagus irregularis DAOM 181602=DAOM 197198]
MSLSDKTSGISELNSLPTLFLLEGPKFPSFDFKISPSNQSKSFKIKNQTIYLYPDNDNNELFMNDDDHAVKTANNVWDASLILSKFLEKQCNENKLDFKGKKVIELGAGKSIPSLTSSILGASMVTITDAPIVIPEIEKIIKLNGFENNNVLAKPLDWENRKDYIPFLIDKGPWDFILAADVIWVDYLIVPLVDSIDELSTPSYTTLLLCHQSRTTRSDNMLFDTLKKRGWKIQKVSRDELNLEEGFWKDNVDIYQGQKEQE